jgi:hypothetical protein
MTTDISLDGLWKVSRRDFFKSLGKQKVLLSVTGDYPYTSVIETGDGKIIGKIVSSCIGKNKWHIIQHYYIADHKDSETCQ